MIEITNEFKEKVVTALLAARENYDGSDTAFAKKCGIDKAIYNRIKGGEREKLIKPDRWLNMGRLLGVSPNERKWNLARTEVMDLIEEEVRFCKEFSKGRIFVDDCAIGKTTAGKYLARTLKNCFYIDASQAKTRIAFTRALASCIGVDGLGRYVEVKDRIKYALNAMPKPIVFIDEAGDLTTDAFLDLKEYWNGTDGTCGWYLAGAEGLRAKMESGINHKKVGYREMFSRLSDKYSSIVPTGKEDKVAFYRKLISDVLTVNMEDKSLLNVIVKQCLTNDDTQNIGGLRRAESLLILNQ